MRYISEIFWKHSLDVPKPFPNNEKMFVCLSVCQLAYFLTEIRQIQGYLQFCMRYLSEIFWRHSWDVCTLVPNDSEIHVCLLVCQFAYFLTEIRQMQGYLQFWMRYFSKIFWRHSWDVGTLFPNTSEFCQLAYFLTEIRQTQGYLKFWMRHLSEIFGDIPGMLVHQFQITLNFLYVCQSVIWSISSL